MDDIRSGSQGAPEWAVLASQGSFEKLGQLIDGPEQELRSSALTALQQFVKDPDFLTASAWRDVFKERARAQKVMGYWVSVLRDALYDLENQKSSIMNVDQDSLLKFLSSLGREKVLNLLQRSLRTETAILQNRDVQLLLEEFWVQNQNAESGLDYA
ncbi:MAG: hypothetical protein EOP06_25675 [Proteobacteria bacterium]|nr:MAG: hypothetical protein EOP06_25675 [Pseudomonadota bacterium]